MSDIINIKDNLSHPDNPHCHTNVKCKGCQHEWSAVYPFTDQIEQILYCPKCNHSNQILIRMDQNTSVLNKKPLEKNNDS